MDDYLVGSDLVLIVIDVSKSLSEDSLNLLKESIEWIKGQILLVANKIDKGLNSKTKEKLVLLKNTLVEISALNGDGLKELEQAIVDQVSSGFEKYAEEPIITSNRQKEVIKRTINHLIEARHVLENGGGFEFASVDIRQALNVLGEITGETITDDILNNIFANFCIGK